MDKRNRPALAYMLAGIAVAGRAFLAVPEGFSPYELSLTVLALVGYLLLADKGLRPLLCGVAQLLAELALCGTAAENPQGLWLTLTPALRAADLWLLLLAAYWMLRAAGQPRPALMPLVAALPLAVYTLGLFVPALAGGGAIAFVVYHVVLLWYTVLMLRAWAAARVKK